MVDDSLMGVIYLIGDFALVDVRLKWVGSTEN